MQLPHGTIIDRYILEGVIGEGGMATVYLARHRDLGSQHAIKLLHRTSGSMSERLKLEGRLQSTLRHPNVVSVTDMVHVAGTPGLVMEYIEGPTLHHFMERCRLDIHQADALAREILRGVAAAHAHGMIHRDLKPANILLSAEEGRVVPKITDFGLAKVLDANFEQAFATQTGTTMGTPGYMAPEQIADASTVDERADVFSIGAILYELVTGHRAFGSDDVMTIWTRIKAGDYIPPAQLQPEMHPRMVQAIQQSLQVSRDERLKSVKELLEIWTTTTKGRPAPTVPPNDTALWSGDAWEAVQLITEELSETLRSQSSSLESGDQTFSFQCPPDAKANKPSGEPSSSNEEISGTGGKAKGPESPSVSHPPAVRSLAVGVSLGLVTVLGGWWAWSTQQAQNESEPTNAQIPTAQSSHDSPEGDRLEVPGAMMVDPIAACGNRVVDEDEECDDGNDYLGDLCRPDCTFNVARIHAGVLRKGYSQADVDGGMPLLSPSRIPDEVILEQVRSFAMPNTPMRVAEFWIMRTEVSRGAWLDFLTDDTIGNIDQVPRDTDSRAWHVKNIQIARNNPRVNSPNYLERLGADLDLPHSGMKWEAVAYCSWLGGFVPTEAQWELAARGSQDRVYPWGDRVPTSSPEDCDLLTSRFHITDPTDEVYKYFNCGSGQPTPVGSLPAGCTPEGVCDMSGNLDEIVHPGAVIWEARDCHGSEESQKGIVAMPAGVWKDPMGNSAILLDCLKRAQEDPFGLVSGQVSDCVRVSDRFAEPLYEEQTYPAESACLVVRGGNFDDSLALRFQTRARYPVAKPGLDNGGFRCAFHRAPSPMD